MEKQMGAQKLSNGNQNIFDLFKKCQEKQFLFGEWRNNFIFWEINIFITRVIEISLKFVIKATKKTRKHFLNDYF